MRRLLLLFLLALPAFSQHAWWRLNVTAGNSNISIAEWKFFDISTAQIATTGGTPLASSTAAGTAANAFDGSAATFWASSAAACTLQYHFGSAVDPVSFTLQTRNDLGSQVPVNFSIQFSDDGSAWTDLYLYQGVGWTGGPGGSVSLTSSNAGPATIGISWRLLITASQSGNNPSIAELKFFDTSGSQYTADKYAAIESTFHINGSTGIDAGSFGFDGNVSTHWQASAAASGGAPQPLGYRFASGSVSPATFSITAWGSGAVTTDSPSAFSLQYSNDEITWTTIRSYTAAAWPATTNPVQTFGGVQVARHRVNTE